jgi:REP element-mobilizing transposase RayT
LRRSTVLFGTSIASPFFMTAPRQVLPGTTYLITRRCSQRQFLLRPSNVTNSIFLYVLAIAAKRFGVEVHAFCVMSNHFHLVVTDRAARLPAFGQYLDSLVARAVNASLGRWESFWGPSSYSAVVLTSPDDVLDKVAYVLANPVTAGLVQRGRDWPGVWSAPHVIGGPAVAATRPAIFFRTDGEMPATAELVVTAPPGFESPQTFRDRVVDAVAVRESTASASAGAARRTFLGIAKVVGQDPAARPTDAEPRRALNPRIAARDRWKRIEALTRLRAFLDRYRAAWRARRAGDLAAIFPRGTYLMRIAHGVPCAPA